MTTQHAAIFIESNTTPTGVDFLHQAVVEGFVPIILCADPLRYPFLSKVKSVCIILCNCSSDEELTTRIDQIAAKRPVALILSSSDYYVVAASKQARRLGLPGPDPEAVAVCHDKALQQKTLAAAGLKVPERFHVLEKLEQIASAIRKVGFPAVVKPVIGTGSLGVKFINTEAQAKTEIRKILSITINGRGELVHPRVLLASYLTGNEFSVEILDGAVLGVTAKHLGHLPHFVEVGHDFPASISEELHDRLATEARRAIAAIGLTQGPAHIELRADECGVAIIEVNPRLAGGAIPTLMKMASGIDPVSLVIKAAAGLEYKIQSKAEKFGALRFLMPHKPGLFAPIWKAEVYEEKFNLDEVRFYRSFPLDFQPCNDFRDRLGHVIAIDSTSTTAIKKAEDVIALICNQRRKNDG